MECFLCGEGHIVLDDSNEDTIGYIPYCNKCGITGRAYATPEAALEAMMPKVDEGLIKAIKNAVDEHYKDMALQRWGKNSGFGLSLESYIKQELEKYWREG